MRRPNRELEALVARLPFVAKGGWGITTSESAFAASIYRRRDADDAVPLLMPYLHDARYGVRQLAVLALDGMPRIDPRYLDTLVVADSKDNGWLSVAIAKVGTPRAIDYLMARLRSQKEAQSQAGSAFRFLGVRGVLALCSLLRHSDPGDEKLQDAITALFADFGPDIKRQAVGPLHDVAFDTRLAPPIRQTAISAMGALGSVALPAIPSLQALAASQPALYGDVVGDVLIALRLPSAVPVLMERLKQSRKVTDDRYLIYDHFEGEWIFESIAELGSQGRAAGPGLMPYLDDANWDVRCLATKAIAYIDYRGATPALIQLLRNAENWRIVWTAADGLGRLLAVEALPELHGVAETYWYPPVRTAARKAIQRIQARVPNVLPVDRKKRFEEFQAVEGALPFLKTPPAPIDQVGQRLVVPGGILIGRDSGEWGGGLTWQANGGVVKQLIGINVCAVAMLGGAIVAATGIAHLTWDFGDLHLVTPGADGAWDAIRWRVLPGAPWWAQLRTKNGVDVLRVACSGGLIEVTEDGQMRMAAD